MNRDDGSGGNSDPGTTLIAADPAALVAFAEDVRGAGRTAGPALGDYQDAMMTLDAQARDPQVDLPPNRLFEVAGALQGLQVTCTQVRSFAAALRLLDSSMDGRLNAIDGIDPSHLDLFLKVWEANPDLDPADTDLPGLLSELHRQTGAYVDDDLVRTQLDELIAGGHVDYEDREKPALIAYLINRGNGTLDITEEFEAHSIAIDDDGSLQALGMDDWDPAVLAEIEGALDEQAGTEFSEYVVNGLEFGHLPQPPAGHYTAEDTEAYWEGAREWRRGTGEDLIDKLEEEGERGFYSADLYDELLTEFNSGETSRFDEAFLHAMTQSGINGPTPIYSMSGWEKTRDGVGKVAEPVGWLGLGLALIPGLQPQGWVIKGTAAVAATAAAIDITDACVVNNEGGSCVRTISLVGLQKVLGLKSKLAKAHFLQTGPLTEAEERLVKGLEAWEAVTGESLSVVTSEAPTYDDDE